MADEVKYDYDAGIQWSINSACNLSCAYCWSNVELSVPTIRDKVKKIVTTGIRAAARAIFSKLTARSSPVNIPAFMHALEETRMTFLIGITGGEPFLVPNIVELCVAICKKHYLSLNTNLTSKKIEEFAEKVDPARVVSIHASCHIKELERTKLLDRYISNFLLCKKMGFSIHAFERAYPPLLDGVKKYREFFKEKGIELRFAVFFGEYGGRRYPGSYTEKEIMAFGIGKAPDIKMSGPPGRACNAGYNVAVASSSGKMATCYGIGKHMGNLYKKIYFRKELIKCPKKFCACPLYAYSPYLFKKALSEKKGNPL